MMSALFRSFSSLLFSQQLDSSGASSLVLERLYYADGRQNPDHPLHGSFTGLSYFDSP
ncbi:cyanate hydratase [Synechococcus sp. PROS-7-1]|nr:cyanate hydratase [Synechococcus sp. PROS-7-1]